MSYRSLLVTIIVLWLLGCAGGALRLAMLLPDPAGLQREDPVVLRDLAVGRVAALEPGNGGYVATLEIQPEFRAAATREARFVVVRDPNAPERRRVEIRPGRSDAAPLADGASVRGEVEPEPLLPFGEILRGFTDSLGELRNQVERFRSELQRLPDSPQGRQLRDEWQRLLEEMKQAQNSTEDTVKKRLVPELQKRLDELEKQFRDVTPPPPPPPRRQPSVI